MDRIAMVPAIFAAASAHFAFASFYGYLAERNGARSLDRRLDAFVRAHANPRSAVPTPAFGFAARPEGALEKLILGLPIGRTFLSELSGAGMRTRTGLFLKMVPPLCAGVFAAGWIILGSPISGLALSFGAILAIRVWIRRRSGEKKERLLQQLPEALILIASALSSGASLVQALEHAVRESAPPVSEELSRVVDEVNIGVGLDDALGGLSERLAIPELESVVVALTIQRRTGGNLSELLVNGADLLKERSRLKNQLLAETAQARFSGKVVGLLPAIVLGITFAIDPGYLAPLFETATGLVLLGVAFAAELSGFAIINGMLKVDF